MPVKHLQVPRYMSFLNNFDLNGEAGWYRGMNSSLYFSQGGFFYALLRANTYLPANHIHSQNKISQRKERMIFSYESYNEGQTAKN